MATIIRDQCKNHGTLPNAILALTPAELMLAFFKPTGSGRIDRDSELAEVNRRRAEKRQKPVIPSWFWPHLKAKR